MAVKGRWIVTTGTSCRVPRCGLQSRHKANVFCWTTPVTFGSWLPYVTGGLAVGRVSYSDFGFFPFLPSSNTSSITQTRVGWTAGGGVEWKFDQRWSIKAEYLYVDLGSTTDTSLNSNVGFSASIIHNHHLTENIARIGLNYSFWSSPN